jgi:CelD/BcsL family acetyltransferase involved in cellulose biosynthesis
MISITRISEDEFSGMRGEWNHLLEKSAANEVFLSWEWMYSWWDVFKRPSRKLLILLGKNSSGKIIGIAPFYVDIGKGYGLGKKRILRFCSSLETYPDHLDLIYEKDYGEDFLKAIFRYLNELRNEWEVIKLDGVREDSLVREYFVVSRPGEHDFIVECLPGSRCPYIRMDQSFKEYLNAFSAKKRQTLLRKRRILIEKEHAVYKTLDQIDEVDHYFEMLWNLHAERSTRKGITTTFCGERIYDFHKKFISMLLDHEKVVMAFIFIDLLPLAAYYCLRHNKKFYYYQAGISEEGEKRSAGSVLLSLLIEQAFQEGCREFDLLRGEEDYKYFWTDTARQNYSITIRKNNLAGAVSHKAFLLSQKMRMVKRKWQ